MVDIQEVYVHPACPHCWKVAVGAEFVGKTANLVHLTWEQTKQPEYLAKNPTGKVPAVKTAEGILFESHAILRALAKTAPEKALYGANSFQAAQVDQWLDFVATDFQPAVYRTVAGLTGYQTISEKDGLAALEDVKPRFQILENQVKQHQYLVGDKVTIADIALCVFLRNAVAIAFDDEFRKAYPAFFKYYDTVANLPEFRKVLGRVRYCQKRWAAYQPPAPQKEEKKQPEKAAPKKKKDDEEEEEEAAAPPKKDEAKIEMESLPPTNFNFFDFKTLMVNSTDKKAAMDTFWQQLDKEGFSLWYLEYLRVEGEGKVLFLTNNLMNGFIQRLEHFRKYSFGVIGVYGDEGDYNIKGVLCWRGTKIPLMVKEHDQFESYKFEQLNPDSEADRNRVTEYWTKLNEEEDKVEGATAQTVKYFK